MAKIQNTGTNETVFAIKKWLGVNECPDGDTRLKMGEAAAMTNFKITDDGSLQIRGGTQNIAGLLNEYSIEVSEEAVTLETEINFSGKKYTLYPNVTISESGVIDVSGTGVEVSYANHNTYAGYYYKAQDGSVYKFADCVYTQPSTGILVNGGSVSVSSNYANVLKWGETISAYAEIAVINAAVDIYGSPTTINSDFDVSEDYYWKGVPGIGSSINGVWKIEYYSEENGGFQGALVSRVADDTYAWNFFPVTATTESTDTAVRGIWSGYVGGTEYLVAACNGFLWALSQDDETGAWTKSQIGSITTTSPVHFFAFDDKLYMQNGTEYKVWDGETLKNVSGYVPLVATATPPAGGGTLLEQVNKLTGSKRQKFSPDGQAKTFQLLETNVTSVDWVKLNGVEQTVSTEYTVNTANGTVEFTNTPTAGTNTVEIQWTKGSGDATTVKGMKFAELFNGTQDTRVFLYGDGSNMAIYSGLDENGTARADYFPDLNVMHVGDANTPITSMVRHYSRMLAFKEDSAYSVYYDTITLPDNTVTAGFYVTPVNKAIGNIALGQAQLVENRPRTLDGRSIYEWRATSTSGNVTGDQRNAQRISQRIENTLLGFDLKNAITYFDKINHEYYIVQNGTAVVNNTENDTWYIYRDFPATCMIVYKDEFYFGTPDGYIRHVSRKYTHDCGEPITAYWESGSMDFGYDYKRKNSAMLWVGLKPEVNAAINVTVQTDRMTDYDDETVIPENSGAVTSGAVSSGFFDFLNLDFEHFTFNVNDKPQMARLKLKVKKFTYYKLIFSSVSATSTATITSANIKVRYTGNVR